MLVIGLTGSMASGKSTAARLLQEQWDLVVFDADQVVHELMAKNGEAVRDIMVMVQTKMGKEAQDILAEDGGIDRKKMRHYVGRAGILADLEAILHPLVSLKREDFLKRMMMKGEKMVVLDIPLLFEGGANKKCDKVIHVRAARDIRQNRLRERGLSQQEIELFESRQWDDDKKRQCADYEVRGFMDEKAMMSDLCDIMRILEKEQ